jgi:5'-3' exoribonuclease 1
MQGVDCGEITLLLHVRPCEGLVRQVDGTIEKRFAKKEVTYPMELVVRRNPSPDPRFQPETATASLVSYDFKPGARALFLGRSHYGCMATVLPDASAGLTKKGQQLVAGAAPQRRSVFRVSLEPGPTNMTTIAQAAKRVLGNINVQYSPSGQVARRLGVSHRTLGRMTGNVWLQAGEERRDRVDVGLCVKNGGKGLYVPDFARPLMENGDAKGWAYSESLVRVLDDYRRRFPWLWAAIEMDASPAEFKLDDVLPDQEREQQLEQIAALRKWLKGLPLSRRPLVKLSAQVAPEPAVKMLQAALPPRAKEQAAIELENVAATLLLPPTEKGGMTAALAGGVFDIGDRVAAITGSGSPPFGSRGTVVGTYDDAVEVVFDAEVPGGSDLYGRCNGNCGMLLPASDLLNLSKPSAVKAEGQHAPRVVRTARQQQQPAAAGAGPSGQRRQQQPSAAAALQAATAGLSGMPQARAPTPPAAANGSGGGTPGGSKQQPRLPDQSNAKGFSMGRGKTPALPPGLLKKQAGTAAAPGAPAGPPAVAPAPAPAPAAPTGLAAGNMLLAQLQRSTPTPNQQQPQAPAAPPAPGAALLQQLQRGVLPAAPQQPAGLQPMAPYPPLLQAPPPQQQSMPLSPPRVSSVPPGQALLAQLQSPAKAASLPAAAAGPAPTAPPPGLAAGSALLQQLQRPAAPAVPQPQPPPPPAPGMQLLSQLQQGGQPAPAPPAPPPAAATATLLQRLQGTAGQAAQAPAQPQPQPLTAAPADLSSLWQRLQQQHMPAEAAAAAAAAPPPPAVPASLLAPAPAAPAAPPQPAAAAPSAPPSGAVPAPSDLWRMLQNAGQKK